ncbi:MAG: type II toxin-antitoxin system VapC family toxin [Alphaproteobacteria bacterium]|nr:type II toxin-antitoxin system VapC family toxin [Alphaproteobacteria bacterium]
MRLVDSSAWIEWLIGSPVGETIVEHLPEQDAWLIPTMVQFELAKWLTRECGESIADQVIAFTQVCSIAPLDTEIALAAAEICRLHGLASADAIILATARAHDADLLTCDRHFEGLPGVILIPKT